jgi:hypothetical protein
VPVVGKLGEGETGQCYKEGEGEAEAMIRTFVQTREFSKCWDRLGFTDDELRLLELEIMKAPKMWPVIQGTGKLRKMRFAFPNRGKSGSVRVCYVDFDRLGFTYLITIYSKNEKDTLSMQECNNIRKVIEALEQSLAGGRK